MAFHIRLFVIFTFNTYQKVIVTLNLVLPFVVIANIMKISQYQMR
jgi:hypothetical protein